MNILGFYQDHIKQKLSPSQVITLQILLYLISVHKTVQISKLSNYFPLPIKLESKRKHIQRFLTLNDDFIWELVENLMSLNPHKLLYYQRGLKAMN